MNLNLSPDACLEILRAADSDRIWNTLDDERVCLHCKNNVTGRQIVITRDTSGRFLLHCPTNDCASTVEDWLYLTHVSFHGNQPAPQAKRRLKWLLPTADPASAL